MSTVPDRPTTPRPGKRLAVVIGVNEAPESGEPPLKHALDDAKAIAEALKQYGKFEVLKLLGKEATSDKVKDAVLDLIYKRQADDFLLLYFAGHGYEMQVGENDYDGYLVTSDFSGRKAEQDDTRYVSMSWLRDKLFVSTDAGSVLIILDCCYAGTMGRTASDHFLEKLLQNIVHYLEGPGRELERKAVGLRWAMVAADFNQVAKERDGHGVMTGLLLRALCGEVDKLLDDDGQITLGRLHDYLTKKMPEDQRPGMSGNNPGRDPCILAWHSERPPLLPGKSSYTTSTDRPRNYIPHSRNPLFQPRPDEFEQLERLLFAQRTEQKSLRLGLVGIMGLGKTELAIQLTYHYKDRFPAGIFYMTAMGSCLYEWQPLVAKLAAQAAYLPLGDDVSHPEKELRRAQYFCRYLAKHTDALLILDHVEEPSLVTSVLSTLAGGEVACTLLYTSRERFAPLGMMIHIVEQLPEEGALRLLLATTRPALLTEVLAGSQNAETVAAHIVCQELRYLPLALVYLQGLLAQDRRVPLARLAKVLRERRVFDTIKTYEEDAVPLFEIFRLSWEQVRDEEAQQLFKLASYFPEAAPIPLWLLGLAAGVGGIVEPLWKARVQLEKLNLFEGLPESQVRLHPLVRAFGQRLVAEDLQGEYLLREAGKRLTDEFVDLNRLERRAQREGYSGCLEQVRAAREYAELLGTGHGEQLGWIERWLVRENYLLGDKRHLLGDKKSWPKRIPRLFYQQIANRSVEEGHPLPVREPPTRWLRQVGRVNVEDQSLLMVFSGHAGKVRSARFSPDGTKVLSGSDDQTARLWEMASGKILARLEGHSDTVTSVAFSSDGEKMVTGSFDRTALIWETTSGKLLKTLEDHTERVMSVAFSPDGTKVLTGSDDQMVRLWDTNSGQCLKTLKGHTGGVWSATFSPDGTKVLTGSDDQTARLWDTNSGQCLKTLRGHTDMVTSVAFSPDGIKEAIGSTDQTVQLRQTNTGKLLKTLRGHTNIVTSVAFSPDGTKVLSGSDDQTARLWQASTGKLLKTLRGHAGSVRSVAFSPDGTKVLTGSDDQTARLWRTVDEEQLEILEAHTDRVKCVAFSPDGSQILTGSNDQTARLWEVSTGKSLKTLRGHTDIVTSVAFSPDGTKVATGSADQTAQLWEIATSDSPKTLRGHTDMVTSIAFSPDGTKVATGSTDQTVRLWHTTTGQPFKILQGRTRGVRSVAFSPDGTQVLAGSDNGMAWLWEIEHGSLLTTLKGQTDRVKCVAFSPDGTKMLTGSDDGMAWLWERASNSLLATLTDHKGWVTSAAFSPNSRFVITCDQHRRVLLWQASGAEMDSLLGIYDATYEIGAVHWESTTHVVLADMGGPFFRPHFYRLKLEGIE